MKTVVMPAVGMAMTEGIVRGWRGQSGDSVLKGEIVLEIETDKALFDVESPTSGTIGRHRAEVGETVPVGQLLVRILEDGDPPETDDDSPVASAAENLGAGTSPQIEAPEVTAGSTAGIPPPRHTLSPRQRALLREASGQEGAQPSVPPVVEPTSGWSRDLVAGKVAESWRTIPHFAVVREVDASTMLDVLQDVRRVNGGATVTDLLVRAMALALRQTEHGEPIDIGLAVATERGVAIPVIRDVLALDVNSLVEARQRAKSRALAGRLDIQDITTPPVSTLSNLGPQGIDWFTGVIPLGQTFLLTVGRIRPRVVAIESNAAVRQTLFATLNVDHRYIDGDGAARLLEAVANVLGDAHQLELEQSG